MSSAYFTSTFFKSSNWFWDWLDYILNRNSVDERFEAWDELEQWFNNCSEKELQKYCCYFDEIMAPLTEPWNGIFIKDETGYFKEGGYCLSEDGQDDLNHWIICQGKVVWERACRESLMRKEAIKLGDYPKEDERLWLELIDLSGNRKRIGTVASWEIYGEKITWVVRDYNLTLRSAEYIFQDRFGKTPFDID